MSKKSPIFATKVGLDCIKLEIIKYMEKEKMQEVYNILSQYRSEYYGSSGKAQSKIEESVRLYGDRLPGDLYYKLNQGSASGLFRPAFFQGDLDRSLRILEEGLGK